jgi:glycosyltransferase involved in cell wall biosynthesis
MKISIITVCLNTEDLIERTVRSVVDQDYPYLEYIVIDGGSTDKTIDILQQYLSKITVLTSEQDNGIYDAMNKGLLSATGDLIYFLNSGDCFVSKQTISTVIDFISKYPDADIFTGDIWYYNELGKKRLSGFRKDDIDLLARVINHQSIISRERVFNAVGNFDTKYRIYADYDWLLRATIKNGYKIQYTGILFAYYLKSGTSDRLWKKYLPERQEILKKHASEKLLIRYAIRYPGDFFRYIINRLAGFSLSG